MATRQSAVVGLTGICLLSLVVSVLSMDLYNVRFVDTDGSILIATSNYNYAISSPKLDSKGWRTVSVNSNEVFIISKDNQRQYKTRKELSDDDFKFLEGLRDEISNTKSAYQSVSTLPGVRAAGTYDPTSIIQSASGGPVIGSSVYASSSFSAMTSDGSKTQDMSISAKDADNFSVSKSDLPLEWSRVFYNGDLVTIVYRTGEVKMQPISTFDAIQRESIVKLKSDVKDMQRHQEQQFSSNMKQSMDMVDKVFKGVMHNFPKPPSYSDAVGDAFGNNFPFGSNNNPFSARAGWPFANGAGAGAFAFAGL